MAESSASVSWPNAFAGGSGYSVSPSGGSYRANVDLLDPTALIVSDWPTNLMPDMQSYVSADGLAGSSVSADGASMSVQSMSDGGGVAAEGVLVGLFTFTGTGIVNLSIPYELSALIDASNATSTALVSAQLEFYRLDGADFVLTGRASELDSATIGAAVLGTPNESTGNLNINFGFDDANETFALLNLTLKRGVDCSGSRRRADTRWLIIVPARVDSIDPANVRCGNMAVGTYNGTAIAGKRTWRCKHVLIRLVAVGLLLGLVSSVPAIEFDVVFVPKIVMVGGVPTMRMVPEFRPRPLPAGMLPGLPAVPSELWTESAVRKSTAHFRFRRARRRHTNCSLGRNGPGKRDRRNAQF